MMVARRPLPGVLSPGGEPVYIRIALVALAICPQIARAFDGTCASDEEMATLTAFGDRLASADSPEQARRMAMSKIRLGHRAIDAAERMMPNEAGIAEAAAALDAFEADVASARTQQEVAARFDGLVARGDGGGGCHFNVGEVIVIVVGFVLGIIPGIIFLLLLC